MSLVLLGLIAGAITATGFIPQLIKGHRTKKLDDVSYGMPIVLMAGMSLWIAYGVLDNDVHVIAANIFGISCNICLILMKQHYSQKRKAKRVTSSQ